MVWPLARSQPNIFAVAATRNPLVPSHVLQAVKFLGRWLPVLVWMCVIFSASGDQMSFSRSSRIIGPLVRWLLPDLSDEAVHAVVVGVRKCAHLGEYALLALLFWSALRKPRAPATPPWRWSVAALALALVVAYAATDELHQVFVPSRQGSPWDVLLDTLGGAVGLLLLWATGRLRKRW